MTSYLVQLRGAYFPLHDNGKWRLFGFQTFRGVEASSVEEAEELAVYSIQADPTWSHVRPRHGFPVPRIYPEEVIETGVPVFPDEEYDFFADG